MTAADGGAGNLERQLAHLLRGGTAVACTLVALGLLLGSVGGSSAHAGAVLTTIGVWTLIVLPVARVAWMTGWFAWRREADFAAISLAVLAILLLSFAAGSAGG